MFPNDDGVGEMVAVEPITEKQSIPRKNLVNIQMFNLTQSGSKQLLVGLDAENKFNCLFYLCKNSPPRVRNLYVVADYISAS